MSAIVTNVGIGAAAAATAVAAVFFNPFSLTIPGSLPPPPMEVICASVEMPDPDARRSWLDVSIKATRSRW